MSRVALEPWQTAILERGELYRVGGMVRNEVMGSTGDEGDRDFLVRMITPEDLERILANHGQISFVGTFFGVYKFRPHEGAEVDLVFPRLEQSTGTGHRDFFVSTDCRLSVEDDLGRRDFTINAMAEDVRTGVRIDPFGGERDVRDGIVRMVFSGTFSEDPLRILRGVRFATRLGFTIEKDTWDEMRSCAALVSELSAERIQSELTRTLTECREPGGAFEQLHRLGVLQHVLPELDRCVGVTQNEYHPDDVFVHSLKTCNAAPESKLLVRWAALLHDVGKVDAKQTIRDEDGERVVFYGHEIISARMTTEALQRLRYPSSFVSDCESVVREHMFSYKPEWRDATVRRFISRVGPERLDALFLLREADCRSRGLSTELQNLAELRARVATERERGRTFTVRDLAIDGREVMRVCGLEPGPVVGRILVSLLDAVLEHPERNTPEELTTLARKECEIGDGGDDLTG